MSDYSCYVTVYNQTGQTLTTNNYGESDGYWEFPPPATILPYGQIVMQLSASSGPEGSAGWINVAGAPGALFSMTFTDPVEGNNVCQIQAGGPAASLYQVNFEACSGSPGNWQSNVCPPTGHPLYIKFFISEPLPRMPTSAEIAKLTASFPNLAPASVMVLDEATPSFNCIAWSLGLDYTWVNPPSPLTAFNSLYNTAANSTHSGGPGPVPPYLAWEANSNWNTLSALNASATIDGWGLASTKMTHGSRLLQSADFPASAWTSKLGPDLLITHNRQGLVGKIYGNVLTSFTRIQPAPPSLVSMLRQRHQQMTQPEFFSAADREVLDEAVDRIPDATREEFDLRHRQWLQAIDARLPFSSDTRDGVALPEFAELVALGPEVLPLVVQRLIKAPQIDFRLVLVYDALQRDETLRVRYDPDDPTQFEGEPARAIRSAKLWLQARRRH